MKNISFSIALLFVFSFCITGSLCGQNEVTETKKVKVVEVMPRFPGCENSRDTDKEKERCAKNQMYKFVYKNLEYPKEAIANCIEGNCVVQFFITSEGDISKIKLVRDIGGGCGEASLKVINQMNFMKEKWIPGLSGGEPIDVKYTLVIKFKSSPELKRKYNCK